MIGQILFGLFYANAGEWLIHKYILHEQGRKKGSIWRFHYSEHHKNCRQNNFRDTDYESSVFEWNAQGKEAISLVAIGLVHAPLFPVSPFFIGAVWFSLGNYYYLHKKSHLEPEWGKKNLPWHYDHHMGKDQDKNWCVTFPLFDYIMGTRIQFDYSNKEKLSVENLA